MILRLLTASLILFLPVRALADKPFVGISSFAGLNKRFPCSDYLKVENASPRPIMPVVYGTFGNDWSCVARFISSNSQRNHAIEVHIHNNPCHLNNRCFAGEISAATSSFRFSGYLENLSDRVVIPLRKRVKDILSKLTPLVTPNTTVFLTLGLEDSYSTNAALNAYDIMQREVASVNPPFKVLFVRNPLGAHPLLLGDFIEHHSLHSRCDQHTFVSNDGNEIVLSDADKFYQRHANCGGIILWLPTLQGFFPGTRIFISPRSRSYKFVRTDKIKAVRFLNAANGE